uniref:Uncharacterized protein n=1 Tax=Chromera velia CCMP2878 TaxID=1169474 RepID=A0A0G4G5E7_9ALVE|eukprot:Cvel_20275.t1-p1 / transcript=Cvel_20275.t1 / gene=Cvel_20275 / organism=Chromera_velia_CCMP2878 / gene_product=hypothetical protein / transcript_product=hypothetical protein / location=Cvel_scaffold1809:12148-14154(+) / protein_length=388 / sequence_SO=supercontig / SO=protein_coding / is_pseudo=false
MQKLAEGSEVPKEEARIATLVRQLEKCATQFRLVFLPLFFAICLVRILGIYIFHNVLTMYNANVLFFGALAHLCVGLAPTIALAFKRNAGFVLCIFFSLTGWFSFLAVGCLEAHSVQLYQGVALFSHISLVGTFQMSTAEFSTWAVNCLLGFLHMRMAYIHKYGGNDLDRGETITVMCITLLLLVGLRNIRDEAFNAALEHEIARKEAELQKHSFLSYIMHEVRNPLGAACLLMGEKQELIADLKKLLQKLPAAGARTLTSPQPQPPPHPAEADTDQDPVSLLTSLEDLSKAVQAQIEQMGTICNDVLHLEKLSSGKFEFHFQAGCIAEFFQDITTEAKPVMARAGLNFVTEVVIDTSLHPSLPFGEGSRLYTIADFCRLRQARQMNL